MKRTLLLWWLQTLALLLDLIGRRHPTINRRLGQLRRVSKPVLAEPQP